MLIEQLGVRDMKWVLFALSLFALWVTFNALFMLPGRYTAFNFELAGLSRSHNWAACNLKPRPRLDISPPHRRAF